MLIHENYYKRQYRYHVPVPYFFNVPAFIPILKYRYIPVLMETNLQTEMRPSFLLLEALSRAAAHDNYGAGGGGGGRDITVVTGDGQTLATHRLLLASIRCGA
jgi:hypothetical protein